MTLFSFAAHLLSALHGSQQCGDSLLSGMLIPFIFLSLTRGIKFLVKILSRSLGLGK